MAEQFPRQFGKYVLLKSLARGGMGEIYLAASGQPGGLSKLCVIKKVIAGKSDRAKVNRFLDEAKVVLRLSHANLVSTFDAGDVGGELFIAMELVEGKDLREIWNRCVRTRTRIPVDVALVVVREIARALGYVHSYGGLRLVHRDVAPPNILLSYFGEVKLTDFGLARSVLKQEHTAPGVVFGRASYLAPEQARGEVADSRTDVYSLGIVLWELLTGQPFLQLAGLDPVTSLSMVRSPKLQAPSVRAPWITADLDTVVLKALATDRSTRFQSAEEFRRSLAEVMTRVAPRADSERVTEFLRGLYRDVVAEESAERERLLGETIPAFRGEPLSDLSTPRTDVFPPATAQIQANNATNDGATVVAAVPSGPFISRVSDAPKESLHVSALRARAGSHVRGRPPPPGGESSGADAPTKVWRKKRASGGQDAAQTFVGRVIDNRYRIHHRIGEGGMGTVYAAEHVEIGRSVAVKILHRVFSGEEQLVERFKREARAASRVGHPHIIEVTDFGTTEEGCAYFVMELLEGLDLADVLVREGRLEATRAVRIAVQICQALEAAHASGIIHRDLKPENIFLVAREGQADFVKVLDFGIARNLSGESRRLTNPGMAMGTPEYMAPEQTQGKPADRRSDVYGVGALLHEMVMGVAPFQSESQQKMLEAKRRPLPSLRRQRPDVDPALDAIIVRSLAPDPDRRPPTMAQLEYELAKIVWGRPQAVANLLGLKEGAVDSMKAPGASMDSPGATMDSPVAKAALTKSAAASKLAAVPKLAPRTSGPVPSDHDRHTPPPPVSLGVPMPVPRLAAPAVPAVVDPAPAPMAEVLVADFEKLLEADLTPEPRVGRPLEPSFAHQMAAPESPVPKPATELPRQPERRMVLLLAFVLIGGAAAWAATNGVPQFAQRWVQMLRDRSLPAEVGAAGSHTPTRASPAAAAVSPGGAPLPQAGAPPAAAPRTAAPGTALSPGATAPAVSAPATAPRRAGPEIVQTPPVERARSALAAGMPDDAVAVLRPVVGNGVAAAKPLLAEALVASGWKDVKVYRWNVANRKAREAISLTAPAGPSRGGHALLGEALYALRDFNGALTEFTKALEESPRDPRLRRRVIRSRRQLHRAPAGDPAQPSAQSMTSEAASE